MKPNKPIPLATPPHDHANAAEEAAWWEHEKKIQEKLNDYVHKLGVQVDLGDENMIPDPEDAIAHLKQLPPDKAIEKAREWTGRTDITTLDEAIAAVKQALGSK